MKRALQITMLVVATAPLALGIIGAIQGAEQFVDSDRVTLDLDQQLRFYGVWFTVAFFLTVWAVRNLDIAGPVMRIYFGVMAVGGLARVYAMIDAGEIEPAMLGAAAVEIGVLAFIPWHAAVLRREPAAISDPTVPSGRIVE